MLRRLRSRRHTSAYIYYLVEPAEKEDTDTYRGYLVEPEGDGLPIRAPPTRKPQPESDSEEEYVDDEMEAEVSDTNDRTYVSQAVVRLQTRSILTRQFVICWQRFRSTRQARRKQLRRLNQLNRLGLHTLGFRHTHITMKVHPCR